MRAIKANTMEKEVAGEQRPREKPSSIALMCVCAFEGKILTSSPYPHRLLQAKVTQLKGRDILARHRNNKIKHLFDSDDNKTRFIPANLEMATCSHIFI